MFKFKVIYDNLVTDDVIEEIFEEKNIAEADKRAYKHSKGTGLSEGNYDLYIELGGNWIDTLIILEATEEEESDND